MSYDLSITGSGDLDLDLARTVLGGDPDAPKDLPSDEALWLRDALSASILFTRDEIGIGVSGDDVSSAERARDFEELLRVLLGLADRLGAELYDQQFDRVIGPADVPEVVGDFA